MVRADSVGRLTAAGQQALADYGVRTVVDLRAPWERRHDRLATQTPPVATIVVPIDSRAEPAVRGWPSMTEAYLGLIERYRRQFAGPVAAAVRSRRAVVVHCAGGRDRTGIVAGMLLRLAGATLDDVAADHAYTDVVYSRSTFDEWLAEARDANDLQRIRRICAPSGRALADVVEDIERGHGSVAGLLVAGGASTDDVDRAAALLRPDV